MVEAGFKVLSLGIESPHDHILNQLGKGFDRATLRESFELLKKFPIFYHGYFIYGNLGETEEEMLYIPKFARELGIDTIACNKLRADKFSPIREVLKDMPQYHLTEKNEIYSDRYSHAALKKINKKIKYTFYSPFKIVGIVVKFIRTRFLTAKDILLLLRALPVFITKSIAREREKAALRRAEKETYARPT
jgi:radical SAM superfamily enzyme YgiQ (UPF0313 family)